MGRNNTALDFWSKVRQSGDCWLWTGGKVGGGYGRFYINAKRILAHRFIYELLIGPIPAELELDHLCRNRPCVNPFHLEAVTRRVNILRGETIPARNAVKTHCNYGHSLEDSYIGLDGSRHCRPCTRIRGRNRYYDDLEKSRASKREATKKYYWKKGGRRDQRRERTA